MDSRTKTDVSRAQIEAAVRAQFGASACVATVEPLQDGWFNAAYAIRFASDHPDAVLRVAPDPQIRLLSYEKDLMRAEVKVYELAVRALRVPIPDLYGYDLSREIIGRDYMFTARLSGRPLNKAGDTISQQERDRLARELGVYTSRIHALKGQRFGYIGDEAGAHSADWKQAFLHMVFTLLEDGLAFGVELPVPYPEIRAAFDALGDVLCEIEEPSLVHWDLWPGNVFVFRDGDGYAIEGITDWERAFWGDPEAEMPMVLQPPDDPFFEGYGRPLSEGRAAAIRHCMYRLYLWLVMVIEAKVRFEHASHVGWSYQKLSDDLAVLMSF